MGASEKVTYQKCFCIMDSPFVLRSLYRIVYIFVRCETNSTVSDAHRTYYTTRYDTKNYMLIKSTHRKYITNYSPTNHDIVTDSYCRIFHNIYYKLFSNQPCD